MQAWADYVTGADASNVIPSTLMNSPSGTRRAISIRQPHARGW
jgi:hypothetical protein